MKIIKLFLIMVILLPTISYAADVYEKKNNTGGKVSTAFIFTNFTKLEKYLFITLLQGKINLHMQDLVADNNKDSNHSAWVIKIQCYTHAQMMWLSESLETTDLTPVFKARADDCQNFIKGKITQGQYTISSSKIHKIFLKVMREHDVMGQAVLDKNKNTIEQIYNNIYPVYTYIIGISKIKATTLKK